MKATAFLPDLGCRCWIFCTYLYGSNTYSRDGSYNNVNGLPLPTLFRLLSLPWHVFRHRLETLICDVSATGKAANLYASYDAKSFSCIHHYPPALSKLRAGKLYRNINQMEFFLNNY